MNNLAQIIQAIATAVNAKLTLKLSRQIAEVALNHGQNSGWIDQTTAGRAMSERRIAASSSRLSGATAAHALARSESQRSTNDFLQEQLNPTGKDLAALGQASEAYRLKLEEAAKELDRVTREHYALKAAEVSERQLKRTERSDESVRSETERRDTLQGQFSGVRDAITAETTNPTGMSPAKMQELQSAFVAYKAQLDDANQSLANVTREQDTLRKAIDAQIQVSNSLTQLEQSKLEHSFQKVDSATNGRNAAQTKFDTARGELTNEVFNPTGKSTAQLKKMADAVTKYELELEKAQQTLARVTVAEKKLQESLLNQAKNQQIANQRHGASSLLRRLRVGFKKAIGKRGRNAFKPFSRGINNARMAFDRNAAKARHAKAQGGLKAAQDAHKANPSAATQAGLKAAGSEAATAEGILGASEALEALGAVAGPVGIAIAAAVAVVVSAVQFVNKQMEAEQKEVERFRKERSTYSAQVSNAIARYDNQSRQLEARSSQATGQSAAGVTEATMRLRESNQPRSEAWEDINNKNMEILIVIATQISNAIQAIDYYTYFEKWKTEIIYAILQKVGLPLKGIQDNTKEALRNPAFDALKLGMNANAGGNKKQNEDLPAVK